MLVVKHTEFGKLLCQQAGGWQYLFWGSVPYGVIKRSTTAESNQRAQLPKSQTLLTSTKSPTAYSELLFFFGSRAERRKVPLVMVKYVGCCIVVFFWSACVRV